MTATKSQYLSMPLMERLTAGPRWGQGIFDESAEIDVGDEWVVVITEEEAEQFAELLKAK